jgi:hypothetical protein
MAVRAGIGISLLVCVLGACGGTAEFEELRDRIQGGASSVATSGGASVTAGGAPSATFGGGSSISTGGISIGGQPPTPDPPMLPPLECRIPQPNPMGGGFVQCGTGEFERVAVEDCKSLLPRPERTPSRLADECWYDADCALQPHGYCAYGSCMYGCVSDSECGDGICYCGDPVGKCVAALCHSNADCSGGYPCYSANPSGGFACQRADGHCTNDGQCSLQAFCSFGECIVKPG